MREDKRSVHGQAGSTRPDGNFGWSVLLLTLPVCLLALGVACHSSASSTATPFPSPAARLKVTSASFRANSPIPRAYTCQGAGTVPSLSWEGAPDGTETFAIIVEDPDAPGGAFTHWVAFNIPGTVHGVTQARSGSVDLGPGAVQGVNSAGAARYTAPCPPVGQTHHYYFTVYALDARLDLPSGPRKEQVAQAMAGHVLAQGEIIGTFME